MNATVEAPPIHPDVNLQERGARNRIHIPLSTRMGSCSVIVLGNDNVVEIGENCLLNGIIKIRGHGCRVSIGAGTTIGRAVLYALEDGMNLTLGEGCMLSHDIYANTSDSHSIIDLTTGKRFNAPGHITIGDRVWLGTRTFISKGVTIGSGSIVGAHAVVTRDVPDNCAAAGNPAKIVRENVSWDSRLLPLG